MTGKEPEAAGGDEQDQAGIESQPGSMAAAQDAAAAEAGAERKRAAEAGDTGAQAEQADMRKSRAGRPSRIQHAAEWLDGKLVPRLGTADLGPYDTEPEDSARSHDVCPLCGHPMGEHQFDRSHHNAVLICPADRIPPAEHYEPLNEVGMPKRSGQEE